jgi:hypothetical protein
LGTLPHAPIRRNNSLRFKLLPLRGTPLVQTFRSGSDEGKPPYLPSRSSNFD